MYVSKDIFKVIVKDLILFVDVIIFNWYELGEFVYMFFMYYVDVESVVCSFMNKIMICMFVFVIDD